jgi:pilus assembly protein TadC
MSKTQERINLENEIIETNARSAFAMGTFSIIFGIITCVLILLIVLVSDSFMMIFSTSLMGVFFLLFMLAYYKRKNYDLKEEADYDEKNGRIRYKTYDVNDNLIN